MSSHKEISATLRTANLAPEVATDALVEYISGRKKAGWSMFQISVDLMELLQEVSELPSDHIRACRGERRADGHLHDG
jgi:hypothetical protein